MNSFFVSYQEHCKHLNIRRTCTYHVFHCSSCKFQFSLANQFWPSKEDQTNVVFKIISKFTDCFRYFVRAKKGEIRIKFFKDDLIL